MIKFLRPGLARSVLLGLVTLLVICYALIDQLGIPAKEVLLLLAVSAGIVAVLAVSGFVVGLIVHLLKQRNKHGR